MGKKLKDLKKFIITVPKDYIVDKNSLLSKQTFLFAREDELNFFKQRNKNVKCCLIKDVNSDDIVVLNNKIAYYQYIYKKLTDYKELNYYNFFELNELNGNIAIYSIDHYNDIYDDLSFDFIKKLSKEDILVLNTKNGEKYIEIIHKNFQIDCIDKKYDTKYLIYYETDYFSNVRMQMRIFANKMNAKLIIVTEHKKFKDDAIISTCGEYISLLKYNHKNIIHVVLNPNGWHKLTNHIKYLFKDSIVVSYLYDILPYHYDFASKKGISELAVQLDTSLNEAKKEFEEFSKIINNSVDYVFVKDIIDNKVKINTKTFHTPLALPKNLIFQNNLDVCDTNKIRFIFLTGYMSKKFYKANAFINENFFTMTKYFLDNNYFVDVYYVRRVELGEAVKEYFKYLLEYPNFRIFEGDSLEILLPKVKNIYHFGIIQPIPTNKNSVKKWAAKIALPSKFFNYLSLGIPIVLHEDLKAMADIINKFNLGIVLKNSDKLEEKIKNFDYRHCIMSIEKFRKRYDLNYIFDNIAKEIE